MACDFYSNGNSHKNCRGKRNFCTINVLRNKVDYIQCIGFISRKTLLDSHFSNSTSVPFMVSKHMTLFPNTKFFFEIKHGRRRFHVRNNVSTHVFPRNKLRVSMMGYAKFAFGGEKSQTGSNI